VAEMSVRFRSIAGTGAAVGAAGQHTVVVDRPAGKAAGQGLGFNGGQLLALAVGGCFCNDLHYVAAEMGIAIESLTVDVTVTFDGEPLLATDIQVKASVTPADPAQPVEDLIQRARSTSTVSNSISRGVPVSFATA